MENERDLLMSEDFKIFSSISTETHSIGKLDAGWVLYNFEKIESSEYYQVLLLPILFTMSSTPLQNLYESFTGKQRDVCSHIVPLKELHRQFK